MNGGSRSGVNPHTKNMYRMIGERLAAFAGALRDFDDPTNSGTGVYY
jgi:hypothetical protein